MSRTISCVIPAWNEAPRIARVLDAVLCHPGLCEVIVVDDGSTDRTAEIVARYPSVTLIRQPRNLGKTEAVARGARAASGSHVMLLDSDLTGLTGVHVSQLLAPVAGGEADVSISLRRNAPFAWKVIGLDYISGERVVPREMLLHGLDGLPRFGLEVHMNRRMIAAGLRLAVVLWPEVESPFKTSKLGSRVKGLQADARMLRDMFRTITLPEAGRQILKLRRMRVAREA